MRGQMFKPHLCNIQINLCTQTNIGSFFKLVQNMFLYIDGFTDKISLNYRSNL